MSSIITRFPPSPTGYLHVGGARTALFNWLYARHTGGRFVLRIEDTDVKRSTRASVDAILNSLEWMGIDWDEGPYFQSERFAIYHEHTDKLIKSGQAYHCTCSPERLEEMRKKAMETGGKPKYDGTCRDKGLAAAPETVVRFRAPLTGTTVVEDVIKGNIVFQNNELDDFIIARSGGTPTYNFVVVVDDITMGINTIIRGDDHVMNTPKQILLFQALGFEVPAYAHIPLILGAGGGKLSKRHGAVSVTEYKSQGHLPDADLAAVLTYVFGSWGNDGAAVSVEEVAALRAELGQSDRAAGERQVLGLYLVFDKPARIPQRAFDAVLQLTGDDHAGAQGEKLENLLAAVLLVAADDNVLQNPGRAEILNLNRPLGNSAASNHA